MAFRFRPARLSFPAGAPFFEEGDVQRHLYLRLLEAKGTPPREEPPEEDEEEDEEEEEEEGSRCGVRCPSLGCPHPGPFSSLSSLEHHYAWAHRSACAACHGRPFPSARLLETHLRERHQHPIGPPTAPQLPFQCLVEGCPEAFRSPSGRKEHLVAHHRYPEDFRFHEEEEGKGGPRPRSSTKGRRAQSTHSSSSSNGGSSNGSVVPMEVAEDLGEEGLPAAPDAMEVGPSGRAEEKEEVAAVPQQELSRGFPEPEKRLYRPRVPAAICFGQGAPRAFADRRRRRKT